VTKQAKTAAKSANHRAISDFLWAAFDDYLASRVLIRSRLLIQGAVLASTAIEKYCKAVLAFRGNVSPGHLKTAHWKCLENFDPTLYATFNKEFFVFLQKCYELRYPDSLPSGFNIVIRSRELLAELDFTALSIEQRFQFRRADSDATVSTLFDELRSRKDERLVDENYLLSNEDRETFIACDSQFVYECRRLAGGVLLRAFYTTPPASSDGKFMREGMRPKGDGKSYEFASTPGEAIKAICERCGKAWKERLQFQGNQLTFLDRAPAAGFFLVRDKSTGEVTELRFTMCEDCEPEKIADVRRKAGK
jgi:hypothetical protein